MISGEIHGSSEGQKQANTNRQSGRLCFKPIVWVYLVEWQDRGQSKYYTNRYLYNTLGSITGDANRIYGRVKKSAVCYDF